MTDHIINKAYRETLRQMELSDSVHKDTLNPLFSQLINNDAYLNKQIGREIQNRTRKIKPMVTFSIDDGNKKDYENIMPISIAKGVPFVSAIVTNSIGDPTQMTASQILELQSIGWEIASHTHSHLHLADLSYAEIENELITSKEILEGLGVKCTNLCYPYGSYNDNVLELARKYYRSARGISGFFNTSPIETYHLKSPIYAEDSGMDVSGYARNSLEYYKLLIDDTVENNGWVIFYMHSNYVDATQLGYLSSLIDYIKSLNVDIVTLEQGLDSFGNIVDTGYYDKSNTTKPHFVVGADGAFSMTRGNQPVAIAKTDEYLNANTPISFPVGNIIVNKVTNGNAAGLPQGVAGTLITDRIQSDPKWTYQEYHVYNSPNVYKRYGLTDNTWSAWLQTNITQSNINSTVILANTNQYLNANVPNDFPSGNIIVNKVQSGANGAGFPENAGGTLITDKLQSDAQWSYQEYHVYGSSNVYKRYGVNGTTWSAWKLVNNISPVILANTDQYLASHTPNDIPNGNIIVNKVQTASAAGMPENVAGTLITDKLQSDAQWSYQEYHVYGSLAVYKRYGINGTTWSAWTPLTPKSGTTANRPANVAVGCQYFDTTLGKPVWCKVSGSPGTWVDATGATV